MSDDNDQASSAKASRDDWFTFAMGDFSADFPRDRQFVTNHMWAKQVAGDLWRFGLTAYAVRLLQDVYFLDWIVDPLQTVARRANIGSIESKKAESDLFSPVAGTFIGFNQNAINDPALINADTYEDGWLIEIKVDSVETQSLLDPDQYLQHLDEAWDVAQRTIKGQANH